MNIPRDYDNNSSTTNEEIENLTNKNKNKFHFSYNHNKNKKTKDVPQIKNFPQYFFVLFIIVLFVLVIKFVPNFYKFAVDNPKLQAFYENKTKMKYFSAYLAELDIFTKIILLASHLILYGIVLSIKTCVDMRTPFNMQSFGANAGKLLIYPIILVSFLSINILMFSPEYVENIFKNFSDSPLFFIYLLANFILSLQINNDLSKIRNVAFSDNNYYRLGCIFLNALQLSLYASSLVILHVIQGNTFMDKFMAFILVVCVNLNSIMFLFTFMFYIFFLKNELDPIKLELRFNYSEEYYIDLDINNKNIL